jgi:hypothetical protein
MMTTPTATPTATPTPTVKPGPTTSNTKCEACPSCSTFTALASVITAIATALLATVIFVLVQIAVCKHFKQKIATLTRDTEDSHYYTDMNHRNTNMTDNAYDHTHDHTCDHTYMEIPHSTEIKLKDNTAYDTPSKRRDAPS